jgi:hypothetical protein
MKYVLQFLYNLLISIDQLLNAILLGHPDETLSSRLGRSINKERYFWVKLLRVIIDTIFWFDTKVLIGMEGQSRIIKHCEKSVMPLEQQNFRELIDYELWSWSK